MVWCEEIIMIELEEFQVCSMYPRSTVTNKSQINFLFVCAILYAAAGVISATLPRFDQLIGSFTVTNKNNFLKSSFLVKDRAENVRPVNIETLHVNSILFFNLTIQREAYSGTLSPLKSLFRLKSLRSENGKIAPRG